MYRSHLYCVQSLAATGFAVMSPQVAFLLRPDLWSGIQDCVLTFDCKHKPEAVHRRMVTFDGYGEVLILARSLENLEQRLQWIVGKPVQSIRAAQPEATPAPTVTLAQREAQAKEAERLENVRKLAAQQLPGHDCQLQRDILEARKELRITN